jgi:prepilin-type N-terminal cleavage/methylation domain-containing protein
MSMQRARHAFTMIELLFVIVIMGIIGGIALETIRQYFEGIYRAQVYTQKVQEADHILEQLAHYFENAIDISIVNMDRDAADGALAGICNDDPTIEAENTAHDYTVVFVGVDTDSLRTVGRPGWSEKASDFNGSLMIFKDANFSLANTVITSLYPASDLNHSAIYNNLGSDTNTCANFYQMNGKAYYTITGVNGNTLTVANNGGASIYNDEADRIKKYLLRTGYAFRVLNDGNFTMFSNFRPWIGENYTIGKQNLLGRGVSSFYADFNNTNSFNERGSVWTLKVCMQGLESNLSATDTASNSICRERRVHVRY